MTNSKKQEPNLSAVADKFQMVNLKPEIRNSKRNSNNKLLIINNKLNIETVPLQLAPCNLYPAICNPDQSQISNHKLSFLFFLYHSPNDCFGGSGISRCLYQGFNLLFTINGILSITHRPALPAN